MAFLLLALLCAFASAQPLDSCCCYSPNTGLDNCDPSTPCTPNYPRAFCTSLTGVCDDTLVCDTSAPTGTIAPPPSSGAPTTAQPSSTPPPTAVDMQERCCCVFSDSIPCFPRFPVFSCEVISGFTCERPATSSPSAQPTRTPTRAPTRTPTGAPTRGPTPRPTLTPTRVPTLQPTSAAPTIPEETCCCLPSGSAPGEQCRPDTPRFSVCQAADGQCTTPAPTPEPERCCCFIRPGDPCFPRFPTEMCIISGFQCRTDAPTRGPTDSPTPRPTASPTRTPTRQPTPGPTREPTPGPTREPTPGPTREPTPGPTREPTSEPTRQPTPGPTVNPLPGKCCCIWDVTQPCFPGFPRFACEVVSGGTCSTPSPTGAPTTAGPTNVPTDAPTPLPTGAPTVSPTAPPTIAPTSFPTPAPDTCCCVWDPDRECFPGVERFLCTPATGKYCNDTATDAPTSASPTACPIGTCIYSDGTPPLVGIPQSACVKGRFTCPTPAPTSAPTTAAPTPIPTTVVPTASPTLCAIGTCIYSDGVTPPLVGIPRSACIKGFFSCQTAAPTPPPTLCAIGTCIYSDGVTPPLVGIPRSACIKGFFSCDTAVPTGAPTSLAPTSAQPTGAPTECPIGNCVYSDGTPTLFGVPRTLCVKGRYTCDTATPTSAPTTPAPTEPTCLCFPADDSAIFERPITECNLIGQCAPPPTPLPTQMPSGTNSPSLAPPTASPAPTAAVTSAPTTTSSAPTTVTTAPTTSVPQSSSAPTPSNELCCCLIPGNTLCVDGVTAVMCEVALSGQCIPQTTGAPTTIAPPSSRVPTTIPVNTLPPGILPLDAACTSSEQCMSGCCRFSKIEDGLACREGGAFRLCL